MSTVDLRSDTVTRPTPAMREAMMRAELGDDVLGDDPTVRALEARIADELGKPAACFTPSGTQANLCAVRAQTEPGDEIIMHATSHVYFYETGGFAAIAGCSARFIDSPDGRFGPEVIEPIMRPVEQHFARSRLLIVENTHNKGGGTVWPVDLIAAVCERAKSLGLRRHLDGARLFNAVVASGTPARDYAGHFDTISTCFSKGLGAPVGSAVIGDEATIGRVRRLRKMFGGAMRQSGLLAAAALYALDHNIERLGDDHNNARRLAEAIKEIPGLSVELDRVETNMVFFEVDPALGTAEDFCAALDQRGVRMLALGETQVRAVTHLDVSAKQIEVAIDAIRECVQSLAL